MLNIKRYRWIYTVLTTLLGFFYPSMSYSTPFSDCPEEAFIVQTPTGTPIAYGADLATGSYRTLSSDLGIDSVFNAVGYNDFDDYIYGWDKDDNVLKRFGSDYVIESLGVINKTTAASNAGHFIAGDVSPDENVWYGYKKSHGMYKIDLSTGSPYSMTKVSNSGTPSWNLTDISFHPNDTFIYAVDNGTEGSLLKINPTNGSITNLGIAIRSESNSTFGAQFFDANGNMYISNNANGNIYKVNLDSVSSTLFAFGPSSNSNDGTRCANAPITISDSIDFGDAPDSYGTTLANNGPRHLITAINYLGTNADEESDGYPYPLSDDTHNTDDEDGITFPTGFELGEQTIIIAELNGTAPAAYLNAWVDWDRNGSFDSDELIIDDYTLATGNNSITITVPLEASPGDTWARFRVSDITDLPPTGGVDNGEVEDYPITVTETGITEIYYPSASSFTSIAFEDLYPTFGDFDMNDVIMHVRYTEYVKQATPSWTEGNSYTTGDIVQYQGNTYECLQSHTSFEEDEWNPVDATSLWILYNENLTLNNMVRRIKLESELAAMGASYHNGFGIMIDGVDSSHITSEDITWTINSEVQAVSPLETDQTHAVIIFADDLWDYVSIGEAGCTYLRTEPGCGNSARVHWQINIPLSTAIADTKMPPPPYSPFIFAANNDGHGGNIPAAIQSNPHRSWEVHLKNNQPTNTFHTGLYGTYDDSSDGENTFQNSNGLPWALEIPFIWKHPREGVSITEAYEGFIDFVNDPTDNSNSSWYLEENANPSKTFNE